MDWDDFTFNSFSFAAGLFLLQYGCDLFVENSVILMRRIGVNETLIGVVSTGAEWEELAVVVAAIVQKRPCLGLGNVVGSSIANIIGAFGLGLVYHSQPMLFDLSAKLYAGLLLIMTTAFLIVGMRSHLDITGGIFFLVSFGVYVFSVGWAIYEGMLKIPEELDLDLEERQLLAPIPPEIFVSDVDNGIQEPLKSPPGLKSPPTLSITIFPSTITQPTENSPLISPSHPSTPPQLSIAELIKAPRRRSYSFEATPMFRTENSQQITVPTRDRGEYKASNYIIKAAIGLLLLAFSGYVLAHSASSLASMFAISDTVMGLTILSIGTTLPEKLISIVAIQQEHGSVMVATTAGANIFLLSLCLGVVFLGTDGSGEDVGNTLVAFEIWTAFGCSVLIWVIVWTGGYKFMGWLMLGLYCGFIGSEFTYLKR